MKKTDRVHAMFHVGQTIYVVRNTHRPELNDSLRRITAINKTRMLCDVRTGPQAGATGLSMSLPQLARDIVAVTDSEVTYKLGRGEHTVTISTSSARTSFAGPFYVRVRVSGSTGHRGLSTDGLTDRRQHMRAFADEDLARAAIRSLLAGEGTPPDVESGHVVDSATGRVIDAISADSTP